MPAWPGEAGNTTVREGRTLLPAVPGGLRARNAGLRAQRLPRLRPCKFRWRGKGVPGVGGAPLPPARLSPQHPEPGTRSLTSDGENVHVFHPQGRGILEQCFLSEGFS